MRVQSEFWHGRKVVVTGHTGFKGSWLCLWLDKLGAEVLGIGLPPHTRPNLFEELQFGGKFSSLYTDVREFEALYSAIAAHDPEVVIHLAAQSLVLESYKDPRLTFEVNTIGTVNILEVVKELPGKCVALIATTDKVYNNKERGVPFVEEDPLGGADPYSASKAAAELAISSYQDSFLKSVDKSVVSVRAGNVLGGGDWAAGRLLPDAIRAWQVGKELPLRNPSAIRPWQHVLEPLSAYLAILERLWNAEVNSGAYNIGPSPDSSVSVEAAIRIADKFAGGDNRFVKFSDPNQPYESSVLTLDTSKAEFEFGYQPKWPVEKAIGMTVDWYLRYANSEDATMLCLDDIHEFEMSID